MKTKAKKRDRVPVPVPHGTTITITPIYRDEGARPDAGLGWRLLRRGEELIPGDEYFGPFTHQWYPVDYGFSCRAGEMWYRRMKRKKL